MKTTNRVNRWNKSVATVGLLGAGLLIIGNVPALADPPDHAPAYGYRRVKDDDRYDHKRDRWNEHSRRNRRDYNARYNRYDNYSWDSNYRNRSWAYRDSDGDGVRNGRDRYPMNRHRH